MVYYTGSSNDSEISSQSHVFTSVANPNPNPNGSMQKRAIPVNLSNASGLAKRTGLNVMPAELTGVAPWAAAPNHNPNPSNAGMPNAADSSTVVDHGTSGEIHNALSTAAADSGLARILSYMKKCRPDDPLASQDMDQHWSTIQAAPSPTLLPSLRFHDLVFGRSVHVVRTLISAHKALYVYHGTIEL